MTARKKPITQSIQESKERLRKLQERTRKEQEKIETLTRKAREVNRIYPFRKDSIFRVSSYKEKSGKTRHQFYVLSQQGAPINLGSTTNEYAARMLLAVLNKIETNPQIIEMLVDSIDLEAQPEKDEVTILEDSINSPDLKEEVEDILLHDEEDLSVFKDMYTAIVKFYHNDNKWGIAIDSESGKGIYIHISQMDRDYFLSPGDLIYYEGLGKPSPKYSDSAVQPAKGIKMPEQTNPGSTNTFRYP